MPEGQPPESSGIKAQLTMVTLVEELMEWNWWITERSAGMAVAGGAWARARLREHRLFRHWEAIPKKLMDNIAGNMPGQAEVVLGSGNTVVPISPVVMDMGSSSVVPKMSGTRKHGRGMQPVVGSGRFPQKVKDELMNEGENTRVLPLAVEAEELSLRTVPKSPQGEGSDGIENCIPARDMEDGRLVR